MEFINWRSLPQTSLNRLLEGLTKLYSIDSYKFVELWINMPQNIRMLITYCGSNAHKNEDTEQGDMMEYCREVVSWYRAEYSKLYPTVKPFTLRNPDDLIQFEEFLDRMLHLKFISPGHFVGAVGQCPIAYWDKIDDLRETSFKIKRDSDEYLRCLEKCKDISFSYSEYSDLTIKIKDDYGEFRSNTKD